MQFVDKALARRLESAEEMPQVDCARMLQRLRPEIGASFEPFCGGHMVFAGLNSPIGHAAGLGFDGPSQPRTSTASRPSTARITRRLNWTSARLAIPASSNWSPLVATVCSNSTMCSTAR